VFLEGTIKVWQKNPYPVNIVDQQTKNDIYARYYEYYTSSEGCRMVTFEYVRIGGNYFTA